jgi:single-strand DNA-binding protein
MQLLGSREGMGEGMGEGGGMRSAPAPRAPSGGGAPRQAPAAKSSTGFDDMDDDIPF